MKRIGETCLAVRRGATLVSCALIIGSAARCARPMADHPVGAGDGLDVAIADSVHRILARALADSAFPGAFAIVGSAEHIYASTGIGHLDWAPSAAPDENSIWDLASLSKVIGMTTAMMQLAELGRVSLDAPVQGYLPEWIGPGKEPVTVRHLLTHSSGLPAFILMYKEATSPDDARRRLYAVPLDTIPGARAVYSDIGAYLAGEIVRVVSGETLDVYLARHVFEPLRMTSTMYRPDSALRARIAPTEIDPWRKRHVWGEVHDENAYALGGVSAHAGLFGSAHDLARFARMLLRGGELDGVRIVSRETVARFTHVQDSALSSRALGWDTPSPGSSAGHLMSRRAFGHTGFTGTSIWIDPDRDLFVILLSNRVNPTRANSKVGPVRVALADAVVRALDAAKRRREP
ncbi:MAG: beta-lactamase family protein [Gemmatimonadota bacterium]|nr:beta-lactamase family protein [Gemmatimonadota bacterium]